MIFSVIVAVYNKEEYIEQCLNSILNQKFDGTFEVIAVDDASTDKSLSILQNLSEKRKDARLKILRHETNKGQVFARNTGINTAIGEYIMHVDGDDWLLDGAFEYIYSKTKDSNPDVIVVDSFSVLQNGKWIYRKFVENEGLTKNKSSIQNSFYFHSGTKIAKREIVQQMITGKSVVRTTADDLLYCFEIFIRAKTFHLLPKAFYVGRRNGNSLTQTSSKADIMLKNRITTLHAIKKIDSAYTYDKQFLLNVLNRIINHIFNLSTRTDKKIVSTYRAELLDALKLFSEINEKQLVMIDKALKNKLFAFKMVYSTSGPKGLLNSLKSIFYNLIKPL